MLAEVLARRTAQVRSGAARLGELGQFEGEVHAFWPAYLDAVGLALGARRVLVLSQTGEQPWRARLQWPEGAPDAAGDALRVLQLADATADESPVFEPAAQAAGRPAAALAARLPGASDADASTEAFVLVALLEAEPSQAPPADPRALLALVGVAAAIPGQYLAQRARVQAPGDRQAVGAERLYDVLQLSLRLGAETRFMRAALSLANELAVRFGCDRVSLGWVEGAYVKLTAISHVEKFDRKASASRELETAMEEAVGQETVLQWPATPDAHRVTRAHETYTRTQGSGHLLSLPLSPDDAIEAILCLERRSGAFDDNEIWELRLIGQVCARQLAALRATDRWIGARLASRLRRWRDTLLGPSYTAWKLAGIGVVVLACVLALLPWPYRIDTPLALRSKDLLFMPAPFDGYLRSAHIEVGDQVKAGTILVELDTRELLLEEAMAIADAIRYAREAEKAQATRQLADMQIALSRQQQSTSKLELIRHQLSHAQLRAPFTSIVVEGELKKNLGAPVRKGDLLVKLAHTGDTYLELEVDQVDVHEVSIGMRGQFAFVGRPDIKYPLVVERLDPASTMRDGRNVYLARARIEAEFQPWWRPGMGGSARLEAGDRSVIWILTHRTVRYLRQLFWI